MDSEIWYTALTKYCLNALEFHSSVFHCLPQICIEMADSASLTKVLENYQTFSPDSYEKGMIWYAPVFLTLEYFILDTSVFLNLF